METIGKSASRVAVSVMVLLMWVSFTFSQVHAGAQTKDASPGDEVGQLRKQLADQQKQIEELRKAMLELSQRQNQTTGQLASPNLGQVASVTPVLPSMPTSVNPSPGTASSSEATQSDEKQKPPLTLSIGDAEFTIGGFLDATALFRSTNSGGIGTSFGSIPFSNTPSGQLTETRFTAQNSRLTLMATSKVQGFNIKGYVETDFLGNAPTNLFVTSNSDTLRLRLYWAQLTRDKFEFLAGQSWSLLTPGRNGISPMPGDLFYTQNMDTNYQVGLVWSRDLQFRFAYHPNKTVTAAFSLENPQQFTGTATLPSNFNVNQIDAGANVNAPNVHPDIIAKLAFDPTVGGKHVHLEAAGLVSSFRVFNANTNSTSTATGGGGSFNAYVEATKKLRLILTTFYSDGGGRWIFGLGPDFIVNNEGNPSLIHAGSGITGLEYQVNPGWMVYSYYGGAYFQRNTSIFIDPTTKKASLIGYGYDGSPSSQNKSLQEGTFGIVRTFWKDARYGSLQLITQYSYLTRNPWFVGAGQPKNAHASMGYIDVRYVLP